MPCSFSFYSFFFFSFFSFSFLSFVLCSFVFFSFSVLRPFSILPFSYLLFMLLLLLGIGCCCCCWCSSSIVVFLAGFSVFFLPFPGELLFTEPLVVVAFLGKELLEVRFAIHHSLHRRVITQSQHDLAVRAT